MSTPFPDILKSYNALETALSNKSIEEGIKLIDPIATTIYYPNDRKLLEPILYVYLYVYWFAWNGFNISEIKNNSANCDFTILTTGETPSRNYFVKLVKQNNDISKPNDPSAVDHPIIDSINGIILNKIATGENANYVMKFIDAFQTTFDRNNKTWSSLINYKTVPQLKPEMYMRNADGSSFNYNQPNNIVDGYACISEMISGESLYNIIASTTDWTNWMSAYRAFYEFLITVGSEYGMMHNDLHSGNVFYDTVTGTIRIIDYGRMYFEKFMTNTDPIVVENIDRYSVKLLPNKYANRTPLNSYSTFIKTYFTRFLQSDVKHGSLYLGIIGDIITVSCNILRDIYDKPTAANDTNSDCYKFKQLQKIFPVQMTKTKGGTNWYIIPVDYKNYDAEFTNFKRQLGEYYTNDNDNDNDTDTKKYNALLCIYEGMLYLKIMLLFFIKKQLWIFTRPYTLNKDRTQYWINRDHLHLYGFMAKFGCQIIMKKNMYNAFLKYFKSTLTKLNATDPEIFTLFGLQTFLKSTRGGRKKSRRHRKKQRGSGTPDGPSVIPVPDEYKGFLPENRYPPQPVVLSIDYNTIECEIATPIMLIENISDTEIEAENTIIGSVDNVNDIINMNELTDLEISKLLPQSIKSKIPMIETLKREVQANKPESVVGSAYHVGITANGGKSHHKTASAASAPLYKKTDAKHENRCIYVGARGGKYVKVRGEFVSLKKFASKKPKK